MVVAVEKFIDIASKVVGNANTITDVKELEKYSRDHSFVKPAMPSCVVRPGSVEEVQELLSYANKFVVPVTPLSGGTNNLGGTIPVPGGVVIDLRRMNKVLGVDPRAATASVEPGVTFSQLQDEVSKHGLRALAPAELPSRSSVLSTYLDLAPLYGWVYYGEEILTTMTVVLPDGTLLKTGQQALPQIARPYAHAHITPFAGMMNYLWYQSQGTLGVVVQGWVKLKPRGEAEEALFVPIDSAAELHKVVREIMWLRYARDMAIFNKTDAALFFAEEGGGYKDRVKELREALPNWLLVFVLRQRRDAVDVMLADLKERVVDKLGKRLLHELPGVDKAPEKVKRETLYPSGWPKYSAYSGARTVLPFICSLKDVPAMEQALKRLAEKHNFPVENIGVTIVPTDRIGVVACNVAFMRGDEPEEYARAKKLYYEAAEELLRLGAFYSRPYGILAKLMYSRAQNYYEVLMRIKRTIDPNNIMNPRRLSIVEDW